MIYIFVNIEEIKNTLKEFQAENGRKLKNTQAEFEKSRLLYKKKVYSQRGAVSLFRPKLLDILVVFRHLHLRIQSLAQIAPS